MIIDSIRNRAKYYCLGEEYKEALDFCASVLEDGFKEGDFPLLDGKVVVKNRVLTTKPIEECKWECHRKFVDIHFVASGAEKIGYADTANMTVVDEKPEKDMVYLAGEGDPVTLPAGYFMITFTDDAHLPAIAVGEPASYEKVVAKIPV